MTVESSSPNQLSVERLEDRLALSGVTLITHGFGGSVEGWVAEMAAALFDRAAGDAVEYVVRVTDPGHDDGPLEVVNSTRRGPALAAAVDPEIAILLDWSDVAGSFFPGAHVRNTFDVAAAVAEAMASPGFLQELETPVTELPLHLIGHSRGGSLVGELARQLGQQGIWVDHVTTLDPHPVDGIRDPFSFDFGDAPMVAWAPVVFWDNYWRTDGDSSLDFTGEPIADTYNLQLVESVLNDFTGYSNEHSDVHLWYHGTIDTTGPIDDGSASVSETAGWFDGAMGPRNGTGYYFSRIGGGPRPAAGLTAGIGGGIAQRVPLLSHAEDRWPSLLSLELQTADDPLELGQAVDVTYRWHDWDSPATLTLHLDRDRNPFNGLGVPFGGSHSLASSAGALFDEAETAIEGWSAEEGAYFLVGEISDGSRSRILYDPRQLEVVEPPTLQVTSIVPNASGFVANLNRPIQAAGLSLLDAEGPPVVLRGENVGAVAGSIVVDPSSSGFAFVKAAGPLAADTYTLRLVSERIVDETGAGLDGDGDGTPGGDFQFEFSVSTPSGVVVSLPDFVRGPGQPVHLPAAANEGIPLWLNSDAAVRSLDLTIDFDPQLLELTSATVGSGLPLDSTLTFESTSAGRVRLRLESPEPLPTGSIVVGHLTAAVPEMASADYGRSQRIRLREIVVRDLEEEPIEVHGDEAIHVAAYFGDASGNGRINAADAARIAQVAALLDAGFSATPLTDPLLIGDITGNGRLNAADASRVAQFAALISVPEIPPLPTGAASPNRDRHTIVNHPQLVEVGLPTRRPAVRVLGRGAESVDLRTPPTQAIPERSTSFDVAFLTE